MDPSILFGARGVVLPDPIQQATQAEALAALGDRRRARQLEVEQRARAEQEAAALRDALPGVIKAGFSDEAITAAPPSAQPALLKLQEAYKKNRADTAKTEAETADRSTQTVERKLKLIGGNAFELSNNPNLTLDMVGQFAQQARALGVDPATLGGMPQDASPEGLRAYMRRIANLSVGAADKIRFAGDEAARTETTRHNQVSEANTVRGQDMTDARARENNRIQNAILNGQMTGQPQEISVNGQPVMAVYDKRNGTFYDANTRQPISGGISPKQPELPGAVVQQMAQNEVSLAQVRRGMQLVKDNPDAFGVKNFAPDAIIQRLDPGGVEARAIVGNIAGQKIHDRSGAAVTVGEMARLKPYIPNVNDDPDAIQEKLRLFEREYMQIQQELAKGRSLAQVISKRGPGASESWGDQPQSGGSQEFSSLPDPAQFKGKRMRDKSTGTLYRSDGSRWVRE